MTLALTGTPELLRLPWEYLCDDPEFLAISRWTPVVRRLDIGTPRPPLELSLPIRILSLVSAPSDAEPIDAERERVRLTTALEPLVAAGAVSIDWLDDPTLLGLTRQLDDHDYHVLHFIGHGGYEESMEDGVLLFEDGEGRSDRVSGEQLGQILRDQLTMRLVVLNACEGARVSADDPFSGVATRLIHHGIPSVIGMQFSERPGGNPVRLRLLRRPPTGGRSMRPWPAPGAPSTPIATSWSGGRRSSSCASRTGACSSWRPTTRFRGHRPTPC